MAIEGEKAAVLVMTETRKGSRRPTKGGMHANSGGVIIGKAGRPSPRQPVFNWLAKENREPYILVMQKQSH